MGSTTDTPTLKQRVYLDGDTPLPDHHQARNPMTLCLRPPQHLYTRYERGKGWPLELYITQGVRGCKLDD